MRVEDVPADELSRCDECGKRIKVRQHELTLVDPEGAQELGRYHLSGPGECWKAAEKFTISEHGPDLLETVFTHPDRCGPDQEHCDAGLSEPPHNPDSRPNLRR